ncbi:major facilitator superfamily transporter [Microdochium trichocladiopsis]|uniref:Major facilitator superfamily transporter n=1 Tax=Microdochium trichocladiopsis TaxID=1682393 RepID=A0A9P8Y0R9_9PEZI|nr:major facilitator superfamily transporter [Microdochium trichocladiopsis]KAH7024741.1 major facilitator superfamily transporter [Microdochium trichocladiopsis]
MSEQKVSTRDKVRTFFLGAEATTNEERKLVQKIDFFIMTYCCLAYFFNFLDRAAFANAYVAGLRESLAMGGHDYNTVLSVTTAGMAISQIPHGLIIQKIKPRIWLPTMVVVWGCLTIASASVKSLTQICVIRFFLGFAEGSTYAGTIYIMGSWYTPTEIAKRTGLFSAAGQIGTMFAGVMMTAIYTTMGGLGGLRGWQWVFIIDGIITLPVAVFGFIFLPDIPENTKARYLSEAEKKLAVARVPAVKAGGHSINPVSLAKRLVLTPMFWILIFWSPVCQTLEAYAVQGNFLIWLKYNSASFTQAQINTYPLGVQATGIVFTMLAAWHMDATGQRIPMAVLAVLLQLVSAAMLLVPNLPFAGTFFAFYLSGSAYMVQPLIFGWATIILQRTGDDAVRSVTVYCMNVLSMAMYTFWGIVFYPADQAPYWKTGGIVMVVACFVMLGYMWVMWKLDKYTLQKYGSGTAGDAEAEAARQDSPDSDRADSVSDGEKRVGGSEVVTTVKA